MSARAGTPRFGMNKDIHPAANHAGTDGMGRIELPLEGDYYTETHFAYNPGQASRAMGTTRGGDPGKDFEKVTRQADYMSNHDGYLGGDMHLATLDERKVLQSTIYAVHCEWADPGYEDTSVGGWAPRQTITAFD